MCGISGAVNLACKEIPHLEQYLLIMNELQKHRGPDGHAIWRHESKQVGFAHRRLSIIDLDTGAQPMSDLSGNWITYNGEIYNYLELREELGKENFKTKSDTEVILHAYARWGQDCVSHLRGMFAFALWDDANQKLFCARDRFGIKPFYYILIDSVFYFASEVKALLPFLPHVETDLEGMKDYLTFQFCLDGKTLFKGVHELLPAHFLIVERGRLDVKRFWQVYYDLDFEHTESYFQRKIEELLYQSVDIHLRSDVSLGAYISGGLDSSIVASLASKRSNGPFLGFHGKFSCASGYDESHYAQEIARHCNFELKEIDITANDFNSNISKVIYHLDFPVAGPGCFPQYMVSGLAAQYRKVVLGGQGGDETFGGYARYLIAYFEQCIKGAIEGTMHSGNFIVTYESIIPNLSALKEYIPLLKEFWREGLFESIEQRYFRLVNRAPSLKDEINWEFLTDYSPFETFKQIFDGKNVRKESYFDLMTHFDFKTLLPALLQIEDRVSMAHGLESRVPFLDHPLVELAATIPSNIKFKNGEMKHILKRALGSSLPESINKRKDKMGFPVPLTEWLKGEAREFIMDIFSSHKARNRELINYPKVLEKVAEEPKFGRKIWGLLCLELWQAEFHDREYHFKQLLREEGKQ